MPIRPWRSPVIAVAVAARVLAGSETCPPSALAESQAGPGLGGNRQPQRPSRRSDHQPGEFIASTEAFRHFGNGFVMHVQYDAVAGALEAQHGGGKQIT